MKKEKSFSFSQAYFKPKKESVPETETETETAGAPTTAAPDSDSGPEIVEDVENDNSEVTEAELVEELSEDSGSETDKILDAETGEPVETIYNSSVNGSVFISGRMLLMITDATIPGIVIKGGKMIGYNTRKTRADLVLTENEREELEPLADAVVNDMFKHLSPLQQFLIAISAVYAGKL